MLVVWTLLGAAVGLAINAAVARWPVGRAWPPTAALPPRTRAIMPLAGAILLGSLALRVGDMFDLLIAAGFGAVLLLLAALDGRYRLVPNAVVWPALIAAIAIGPAGALPAVAGAAGGLLFFGALAWVGERFYPSPPLGMGDVKLAMLLGAVVGIGHVWPVLLLGIVLAGLAALLLVATRAAGRKATFPYGSFLAAAGLAGLLFISG